MNHIPKVFSILTFLIIASCSSKFDIDQVGELLFTSIPSSYSGITFENKVVQTRRNNHLLNVEFVSGGGVAVGDINNDGLQDLFFTGNQVSDKLYLNKGKLQFEDISGQAGILEDDGWSTSVTFVDINNDGYEDIYVCRFIYLENDSSANQLYINNGNLTFTERAAEFGIADKGFSTNATFCDFDKDNLVDLYVVNQPPSIPGRRGKISQTDLPGIQFSDRYYKNVGGGKFIDHTDSSNIRNFAFGLSALVGDFNDDSWQDIYISNDFDVADHLYINNGDGTFSDQIKQFTKHITNFSMGSDAADFDNDGHLDIMVVDMVHEDRQMRKSHMTNIDTREFLNNISAGVHHQYMTNTLQRNNGNSTFSELARLAGVDKTGWSWGPLFADFDNDGYKDLFITNGVIRNNLHGDLAGTYQKKVDSLRNVARMNNRDPGKLIDVFDFVDLAALDEMPNYIYQNNGDYSFSNQTEAWGLTEPTTSNGSAYADLDQDGDLDLVVSNLNGVAGLYKNNAVEKGSGNFLRIGLVPSEGKEIYGTKVMIYKQGNPWQVFHIVNTRGFRSKSESIAHFGIGLESEISKVVVVWPDGTQSAMEQVQANQMYMIAQEDAVSQEPATSTSSERIFVERTSAFNGIEIFHRESVYDDFAREPLLPYRLSSNGPVMAIGDVNGDQMDDVYLGGSAGYAGKLYVQKTSGGFDLVQNKSWELDKACEDTDAKFLDFDGDGDLDLIVSSGGNEFNAGDKRLIDRLYINNGFARFTKNAEFPEIRGSSSCIEAFDYDIDGDFDLFIGGRLIPRKYPYPASSYLLENRNGQYVDVTAEKAPMMEALGLVTAATWTDHNNDGKEDLVIVGEWMPVTAFSQQANGDFIKEVLTGLENSEGWYYSVKAADMDDDGDEDLVVGNLGLNYSYTATIEDPLHIFSADIDMNGSNDLVMAYEANGVIYPLAGRDEAAKQIPSLERLFPTFAAFSQASLDEIYGESMKNALHLQANTFKSAYLENLGDGQFDVKPLPNLAQSSVINDILVMDFDRDGKKDLLVAGNLYQTEIEMPRHDAGTGLLLRGDGAGEFEVMPFSSSGFYTSGDVKVMKMITLNETEFVLVGNNKSNVQIFEYLPPSSPL